jgi:hypothetical protein
MLLRRYFCGVKTKFPDGQYSVSRIGTTSNTVGLGTGLRAKTLGLFRFQTFHLRTGSFRGRLWPEWGDVAPTMTVENNP